MVLGEIGDAFQQLGAHRGGQVDEQLGHFLGQFGGVEHQVLALELGGEAEVVEGAAGEHRRGRLGFLHALQARGLRCSAWDRVIQNSTVRVNRIDCSRSE